MNKKANIEELMRLLLWIVFFIIAGAGVYLLLKRLTAM
jgi:hypothetical protein